MPRVFGTLKVLQSATAHFIASKILDHHYATRFSARLPPFIIFILARTQIYNKNIASTVSLVGVINSATNCQFGDRREHEKSDFAFNAPAAAQLWRELTDDAKEVFINNDIMQNVYVYKKKRNS